MWLAHQKGLDRPVAIKFIRAEVGVDPESLARFENEARVTASLQHPSIVRVIDHDIEEGVPWIAYEYLPGRSLSDVLAAGPLSWTDALKVGQQVASALEEAHSKGVIHRDIKPENVLEVEPGRYKLADFGIAKWTAASHIKTRTGFMMGTPTHVPPEQIKGDPPSPQGDVYALGVMIYQMLTGRLPFENENMLGLLRAHLEERVTTPSRLQAGLPDEVDRLVKRALDKAPGERFADGAALRKAIEDITARPAENDGVARPAVEAPPPPPPGGTTSRTRLPRPSGRTVLVSKADVQVPVAPAPRRGVLAIAAAIFASGLAAVALFYPRPVVKPVEPTPSATAAPARTSVAELSRQLAPVHALTEQFDRHVVRDKDVLLGGGETGDPAVVNPLVERSLRVTLEVLRGMQREAFEGPAWVEHLALAADQALQRVQRIRGPARTAEMTALVSAIDTAARQTSADPWRRALSYLVHARALQIEEGMASKAAVEQFQTGLATMQRETPAEWPRTLRALMVRLTFAYHLASSAERADQLGMLDGDVNVPRDVAAAWDSGLSMLPDLHALFRETKEVTAGGDEYWEAHWQAMRTADKVLKLKGFPKEMRARATTELGLLVSRLLRIKIAPEWAAERDKRLVSLAATLKNRGIQLKLEDGSIWPK